MSFMNFYNIIIFLFCFSVLSNCVFIFSRIPGNTIHNLANEHKKIRFREERYELASKAPEVHLINYNTENPYLQLKWNNKITECLYIFGGFRNCPDDIKRTDIRLNYITFKLLDSYDKNSEIKGREPFPENSNLLLMINNIIYKILYIKDDFVYEQTTVNFDHNIGEYYVKSDEIDRQVYLFKDRRENKLAKLQIDNFAKQVKIKYIISIQNHNIFHFFYLPIELVDQNFPALIKKRALIENYHIGNSKMKPINIIFISGLFMVLPITIILDIATSPFQASYCIFKMDVTHGGPKECDGKIF